MAPRRQASAAAAEPTESPPPPPVRKSPGPKPLRSPSADVLGSLGVLLPKAARISEQLARLYPQPDIPLDHRTHFQLLCAVMLSAQASLQAGPAQPGTGRCRGAAPRGRRERGDGGHLAV